MAEVKVGHEDEAEEGEGAAEQPFVEGLALAFSEMRPDPFVDPEDQDKAQVRRRDVHDEAFLVNIWGKKRPPKFKMLNQRGRMSHKRQEHDRAMAFTMKAINKQGP